jgi:hypothetical protein
MSERRMWDLAVRYDSVPWWLDYLFDRFARYRRWRGGHWERWWLDFPVASFQWERTLGCTRETGQYVPLSRGTPVCEDWPTREDA